MKKLQLMLLLLAGSGALTAQQPAASYKQLKEFQGLYEYTNNSTLKIAASPKDNLLYAVIGESKYPLRHAEQDLFLDGTNNKVQFYRNKENLITGYSVRNDTFQLLDNKVSFPANIWYARPEAERKKGYKYQQPVATKDGLKTGDITAAGLNADLLNTMMQQIIDGTYKDVHSILIIKDGKLVFEEYFYQYTKDSLHELRSVTKSFISALTGIAIDKGIIKNTAEEVISYFPEYILDNLTESKRKITVGHLLSNQSGLDCDISNPQAAGNETAMGYSSDWVKYTLDLPMVDTPGGKGRYCSGNPITLGRIIETTSQQALPDFARQNLFAPLGITQFKWHFKPDQSSAETFCQLYLRPRDMAKFGLLYLQQGQWNGQQTIPATWVEQSIAPQATVQNNGYGYLWWIKYLNANGKRYYNRSAQGNGGQRICIWPEQNMVTIITAGSYNSQSCSDELIAKYVLPAFNK
ncbi:serine hydrolase domain-containing protein [Paraflavitalea pollutisoli]|uniref:serine hydrolase domain-containing protein n=1 Tax=Paraflavitalea pollutisoli TaxID=3034143 RepID=UPI0023EE032F|nr:serine hydrolase [Paraflavitalea sp. H1-2-19X]